jgi:hypothetical protein
MVFLTVRFLDMTYFFVCSLFIDSRGDSRLYIASNDWMIVNNELERERLSPNLRCYTGIWPKD